MTCREKLMKEYPEYVSDEYVGGCKECPFTYHYLGPLYKNCKWDSNERLCRACWDREIPETEHSSEEKNVIYLIRIDFKISVPPCYYQAKSIHVDRESNMVIVRGIVKFNNDVTEVDESIIPLDNVLMVSHKKIEVNDDVPAQDEA